MENNKRPRLDSPEEYALIKQIYFNKDKKENPDQEEMYERQDSRIRNLNNNSR